MRKKLKPLNRETLKGLAAGCSPDPAAPTKDWDVDTLCDCGQNVGC